MKRPTPSAADHAAASAQDLDASLRLPTRLPPMPLPDPRAEHDHPSRILIATDAWKPQTNGVVTTLGSLQQELTWAGHQVSMVTPNEFIKAPSFYPGVPLAIPLGISRKIDAIAPTRILIATEGPIGVATRKYCLKHKLPFATACTTRWPEYLKTQIKFPPRRVTYDYLRWFHGSSSAMMVSTQSFRDELAHKGFKNLVHLPRGVDTHKFHPLPADVKARFLPQLPRPLFLYVGRVSKEKNLSAFLNADLPGSKLVVGHGPDEAALRAKYTPEKHQTHFLGLKTGGDLAHVYACADVFVFPSKTDTFGLVMLEALASGLPVAAFNVTGPKDVFAPQADPSSTEAVAPTVGFLAQGPESQDLAQVARQAWQALAESKITPQDCVAYAQRYSWHTVIERFLAHAPVI
ncbi:MAG: glycosyltransferase family 1 protein [Vampirovibrionales bacterium]|nr:glycosyltransferase family 1 protein [Vampirovibrionales bacterium]